MLPDFVKICQTVWKVLIKFSFLLSLKGGPDCFTSLSTFGSVVLRDFVHSNSYTSRSGYRFTLQFPDGPHVQVSLYFTSLCLWEKCSFSTFVLYRVIFMRMDFQRSSYILDAGLKQKCTWQTFSQSVVGVSVLSIFSCRKKIWTLMTFQLSLCSWVSLLICPSSHGESEMFFPHCLLHFCKFAWRTLDLGTLYSFKGSTSDPLISVSPRCLGIPAPFSERWLLSADAFAPLHRWLAEHFLMPSELCSVKSSCAPCLDIIAVSMSTALLDKKSWFGLYHSSRFFLSLGSYGSVWVYWLSPQTLKSVCLYPKNVVDVTVNVLCP